MLLYSVGIHSLRVILHVFFIPFVNTKAWSYAQTKFFSQPVHKISMFWSIQTFSLDINATPILQCSLLLLWQIWQKLNKSCEMQSLNHGGLTGSSQTSSAIKIKMLDYEWQRQAAGAHLLLWLWQSGNLQWIRLLGRKFLHKISQRSSVGSWAPV